MHKFVKVLVWYPLAVAFLVFVSITYYRLSVTTGIRGLIRQQISSLRNEPVAFAALPQVSFEIKTAFATEDARPLVINRYLKSFGSPLEGMGDYIVKTADHFNMDPYLVVAIAQQESNLGKITPPDCHNAWGWGIHSAGTLCFDTWQEGINEFVSGFSRNYLAYGLNTPQEIMTKYNAQSPDGAWAKGIQKFMDDLNTGNW